MTTVRGNLRDDLNAATRPLHDMLDRQLAPLALGDEPARFLAIQYIARKPIEAWLGGSQERAAPPVQSALIAADLQKLGVSLPAKSLDFTPAHPDEAWGIEWALAGSSMGNRAMLHRRRRAGCKLSHHFLADPAMPRFWQALRPHLEQRYSDALHDHAIAGAQRVFETFLAASREGDHRLAA